MLNGIIFSSENKMHEEVKSILSDLPKIEIHYLSEISQVVDFLKENPVLFVLISARKASDTKPLLNLYNRFPQIYFIYYYHTLNIDNFQQADFTYFSHIVVGDGRRKNLIEILTQLTINYWKKIPYPAMAINYELLSPRLKKVMNYIETHDLKNCSIAKIAKYLSISQGYFSQEFKRETGRTFREFMQNLLSYYEQIIFERLDLSAKTASQILGYSELSSFSRSFKKRKGYPPSLQKSHKLVELEEK